MWDRTKSQAAVLERLLDDSDLDDSDYIGVSAAASLATMYLAFAADADRFGELPELIADALGTTED